MRYTVRAGDTLTAIARRTDTTVSRLVDLNPFIADPDVIFPGQSLFLGNGADAAAETAPASSYVIRSGDTLSALAQHFGVPLAELLAANEQITDPDIIHPGVMLSVPNIRDAAVVPPPPPSTLSDDPQWLAFAEREMDTGIDEVAGRSHNPRILEYHATTTLKATDDETPWCSSFVNWCIEQAGLDGTRSAAARSWLTWGDRITAPQRGAVTVFERPPSPTSGHVAFFWERSGDRILVLGGNQSDQVSIASYPASRLLGYRWPAGA